MAGSKKHSKLKKRSKLTPTSAQKFLRIFTKNIKEEKDLETIEEFAELCKTQTISQRVFNILTEDYEICKLIAQNTRLKVVQVKKLFERQAVRNNMIFGLNALFHHLFERHRGKRITSWLNEQKRQVEITVNLAVEKQMI